MKGIGVLEFDTVDKLKRGRTLRSGGKFKFEIEEARLIPFIAMCVVLRC